MNTTIVVFAVRHADSNIPVDSFTTQQWLTPELAAEKAKQKRDELNAKCGDQFKYKVTRSFRKSTARQL